MDRIEGVVRARQPKRLRTVPTPEEVKSSWNNWRAFRDWSCGLQYGGGRRAKELDFGRGEAILWDTKGLRDTKGRQDHITMLPEALHRPLRDQLRRVGEQRQADLALGLGRAPLPYAPARKYPNADRDWAWQWVFPASSHYLNRRTGPQHRHHLDESVIQKAVRQAGLRTGLAKRVTPGGGLRYPDPNHHDLHPRMEPGWPRRSQPFGPAAEAAVGGERGFLDCPTGRPRIAERAVKWSGSHEGIRSCDHGCPSRAVSS
ncbi:MAG: hypothetical protein AAB654_15825 [Acidobacteriota bacterium]